MKFGFLSEGDTPPGMTHYHRYWEIVDEVIFAEKMGFDFFGTSEQHVTVGGAAVSSPEILYSYLFGRTERIRFRHTVTLTARQINHPLRIAERVAAEDILSNGRIELGLGRGNSTAQLRAFEVDLDETRPMQHEAIQLIRTAFTDIPFSFHGDYYNIPPRILVPRPVQRPYPPMFIASTSRESHEYAGDQGLGIISSSNFAGFEYQAEVIDSYRRAAGKAEAEGRHVNNSAGVLLYTGHCTETREQAYEELWPIFQHYLPSALSSVRNMAKYGKTFAYMEDMAKRTEEIMAKADGSPGFFRDLVDSTASFVMGTPDDCIEQIQRFADMGLDEIWVRIDTLPHDRLMKGIEMLGKYVIPHFKDPTAIVKPVQENIAMIRAAREQLAQEPAPA